MIKFDSRTRQYALMAKYDAINALNNALKKIVPFILIVLIMCIYFHQMVREYIQLGNIKEQEGFLNYVVYALSGMEEYHVEEGVRFEIPYIWLTINFYIAYLIGNYIDSDMHGVGLQFLIRTKTKKCWLFGKTIYAMSSVIILYTFMYGIFFSMSLVMGNGIGASREIDIYLSGIDIQLFNSSKYLGVTIWVLPIVTSIVISLMQMMISILIKPICGYIIVAIYIISSAYWKSYFLIGNYSMLLRNEKLCDKGINSYMALGLTVIIGVATLIVGNFILKRKEILEKH